MDLQHVLLGVQESCRLEDGKPAYAGASAANYNRSALSPRSALPNCAVCDHDRTPSHGGGLSAGGGVPQAISRHSISSLRWKSRAEGFRLPATFPLRQEISSGRLGSRELGRTALPS